MLEIRNTEVFGLERAVRASGNPMTTGQINTRDVVAGDSGQMFNNYVSDKDYNRAKKLGKAPVGSAHDHFLLGIHVQFDIKYPQYWTIEAERYHNFEIISSQSKMHRLTIMGKNENFDSMFNKYVWQSHINNIREAIYQYNRLELGWDKNLYKTEEDWKVAKYELFMTIISNLPMGFEMWMTCDLTYLQLKTIYLQRKNHKLKEDWGAFCDWCEELPMFKQLIGIEL